MLFCIFGVYGPLDNNVDHASSLSICLHIWAHMVDIHWSSLYVG